jgi:hypothetical protein
MKRFDRALLAVILVCMPWLAHAQGFKCKQADGSTSYQDHACPAGSASSAAVQTDMSVCVPQVDNTVKRCYHARLSAHCYLQMTGGTGVHREHACVQQASACLSEGVAEVQRCVRQYVQPACAEQVAAARRR